MVLIEDERGRIQQLDQVMLFRNRKNKRESRKWDKLSLPEEAEIHKYGSSSRVLLHLKSNRLWKMLFCSGNIRAKAEVTIQDSFLLESSLPQAARSLE